MEKTDDELRADINARRAKAAHLFDEARKVQQNARKLPFGERSAALKKVIALEAEALGESGQAVALENRLIDRGRRELIRQLTDLKNS